MKTKKLVLLIAALFLIVTPVFAAKIAVTWEWLLADPDVQYFRYQVDGEDPTGWTVVTSEVTNYSVQNLDGSSSYTLYLQQSYDGIYWSASAMATSAPVVPKEPVLEEPKWELEAVEEPISVETTVIEEPVVEEPAVVEPVYGAISVYGYPLSWKFVPGTIDITYPSFVTDEEVAQFIAYTSANNAKYFDGVIYDLKGDGKAVITLPEGVSYEDVEYVGSLVISDLFNFINELLAPKAEEVKVEEPVVEEVAVLEEAPATPVEEAPVVVEAPVVEEVAPVTEVVVEPIEVPAVKKTKAPFRFTMSIGGGAGVVTQNFKDIGNEFKLGFGLGFENFISFNKTVGLSLQLNGGIDLRFAKYDVLFKSFSNVFSLSSYAKDCYAEALLGLSFNTGKVTTHLSGGARFIFSGHLSQDNILGNWKLLGKDVGITLAPMASAGIRFDFTKHFGMGLDVNYAYLMNKTSSNNMHDIDGRIYMSLVF